MTCDSPEFRKLVAVWRAVHLYQRPLKELSIPGLTAAHLN